MPEPLQRIEAVPRIVERRRHTRVPCQLYVLYSILSQERAFDEGIVLSQDASASGFFFESPKRLAEQGLMCLTVHLPSQANAIGARGRIVRMSPLGGPREGYGVAVSLTKIASRDRRGLLQFLMGQVFTKEDVDIAFTSPATVETPAAPSSFPPRPRPSPEPGVPPGR